MVFPIAGGNESKVYDVENSLRFDDGSSAYLNRTQTAGNRRTFTWSAWIKRGVIGTRQTLWSAGNDGNDESFLRFDASDYISYKESTSNSAEFLFDTNQVFRDPSAWYHIVFAVDTTQSSQDNRIKLYVNGSQITSYQNTNYPSQNYDTRWNNNSQVTYLGMNVPDYRDYYDGYMTEVNFVDGSQKAPTDFGEFNDNGVWIPKKYSGSYGTNGYFLEFKQTGTSQNSSGIGADTSGQDNHWAVSGIAATDVTEDTCTNNFATLNPLLTDTTRTTFSEGNCKNVNTNASTAGTTIAVDKGKWYCEMICTAKTAVNAVVGICTVDGFDGERQIDESQNGGSGHGYVMNATKLPGGASYGATWAVDDIMGIALDLDSTQNTITFYKNNSSQGSINIDNKLYVFANSNGQGSDTTITYSNNFGNAPHSISSGNTDENGYGNFEYAPPSGYYALCTKNLAEFG